MPNTAHSSMSDQGRTPLMLPAAAWLLLPCTLSCRVNIRPVDAQRVALGAGMNGTLSPFRIFVEDDQAVVERSCWLKMLDATVRHLR